MNTNVKVSNKEICIPYKLLESIIKETDVPQVIIEEEESELFYTSLTGQGKIFFKNNTIYEGNIKYGILDSGEEKNICKITFPNKTKYEGEIKQNQITGYGIYYFPSGSIYKGDVKNGLRNGYGVYNSGDGVKYEGNWWNGLKHGVGKLTIKENLTYEGEWFEGIKQGNGRIKWPSGNIYDGDFKKNHICGNGYMIWVETNEKYTGRWKDNLQNGLGIHIWYENKGEQKYLRNRYVGEWKNGFRHGYGVFFYSNGAKYEGIWDQNYKHGFGIFTFHDGAQYIGRFHNDRMIEFNAFGYLGGNQQTSSNPQDRISTSNSNRHGKLKPNTLKLANVNVGALTAGAVGIKNPNPPTKKKEEDGNSASTSTNNNNTNQNTNDKEIKQNVNSNNPAVIIKEKEKINLNPNENISNLNNNNSSVNKNNNPNAGINKEKQNAAVEKTSNSNPSSGNVNLNLTNKEKRNLKDESSSAAASTAAKPSKPGLGHQPKQIDIKANINIGLEAISEQAELGGNTSMIQNNKENLNEKKEKENSNLPSYTNVDSVNILNTLTQTKQIVSNRVLKESEYNIFKTLIDLTDIIECEPEVENGLKEVENILLRHLSEMKSWYRFYTNKDSSKADENSVNASAINTPNEERDKINSRDTLEKRGSNVIGFHHMGSLFNSNINTLNFNPVTNNNLECAYNNDLGFAMEMRDLWKFLRDSNIISSEFSLAQFNRLFFKGKKNYIEMFMCPDDLDTKQIYDYIYWIIKKSKEDFFIRYRDKMLTNTMVNSINNNILFNHNSTNHPNSHANNNFNSNNQTNENNKNSNNNSISNKEGPTNAAFILSNQNIGEMTPTRINNNLPKSPINKNTNLQANANTNKNNSNNTHKNVAKENIIENNHNNITNSNDNYPNSNSSNLCEMHFDIHNKKQTVLLRQFFEAIVRAAYLRFFNNCEQSLGAKLTMLVDTCIKNNINFKKISRKSREQVNDASMNNSVFMENKRGKFYDSNFEFFNYHFEKSLKTIFRKFYNSYSPSIGRYDDMTITYKFFFDCYIAKSNIFKYIFTDKIKFAELITIHHKDRINLNEVSKYSKEIYNYLENIYEIEMIFYEFCELIFYISRKYFIKNGLNDTKENYFIIIRDLEKNSLEPTNFEDKRTDERGSYNFPKLKNHLEYEILIANKLAREEEERKKRKEQKRIEYERKMMEIEDMNILPDENEQEEEEEEESMDSF